MATMPQQVDELSLVRELVDGISLPLGVRIRSVEEGETSTGEPAYRIYLGVSGPFPVGKRRLARLIDVMNEIQDQIFATGTLKWPFVDLEEERG